MNNCLKILFVIESLHAGGKERRLVELLKGLSKYENISMELVLTKTDVYYTDIFTLDLKIHYIERTIFKKDPILFFKLYQIGRKFKPDIIHVWGNMVTIYAIPTKILLKQKLLNNRITEAPRKPNGNKIINRISFALSDMIVANSKAGLEVYNPPTYKSTVIYNGFDFERIRNLTDKVSIKGKFNIKTNYIVGMVASFSSAKDYTTYIEAANQILKSNSDITFLCIGSGDYTAYKELVDIEYEDKVLFLGYQDNIETIMNICDIGVLTSFNEGCPNSIMEFMALGKPVVSTEGGGIGELVINNVTGYLVPQRNCYVLAEKLNSLIKDRTIRNIIGENGRQRVKSVFGIEKMVKSYFELYRKSCVE